MTREKPKSSYSLSGDGIASLICFSLCFFSLKDQTFMRAPESE